MQQIICFGRVIKTPRLELTDNGDPIAVSAIEVYFGSNHSYPETLNLFAFDDAGLLLLAEVETDDEIEVTGDLVSILYDDDGKAVYKWLILSRSICVLSSQSDDLFD